MSLEAFLSNLEYGDVDHPVLSQNLQHCKFMEINNFLIQVSDCANMAGEVHNGIKEVQTLHTLFDLQADKTMPKFFDLSSVFRNDDEDKVLVSFRVRDNGFSPAFCVGIDKQGAVYAAEIENEKDNCYSDLAEFKAPPMSMRDFEEKFTEWFSKQVSPEFIKQMKEVEFASRLSRMMADVPTVEAPMALGLYGAKFVAATEALAGQLDRVLGQPLFSDSVAKITQIVKKKSFDFNG